MFPLFCNNCFRRQSHEPHLIFYVSSCAHVLCEECVQKCALCKKVYKPYAINNETPWEIAEYFETPNKHSHKYSKILRFQYSQQLRLAKFEEMQHFEKMEQDLLAETSSKESSGMQDMLKELLNIDKNEEQASPQIRQTGESNKHISRASKMEEQSKPSYRRNGHRKSTSNFADLALHDSSSKSKNPVSMVSMMEEEQPETVCKHKRQETAEMRKQELNASMVKQEIRPRYEKDVRRANNPSSFSCGYTPYHPKSVSKCSTLTRAEGDTPAHQGHGQKILPSFLASPDRKKKKLTNF
uniref:RING-type domain-containing protein n=1 Tax=Stomoxys calcitrans TaxID=35570 RepID=A0A1I8NP54_STOCA